MLKASINAVRLGPGFEDKVYSQLNDSNKKKDFKGREIPPNMKFLVLKKHVRESQVVICKCSSASADYLKGLTFSRVLIDDANKVNESLALVPIVKNCQQLVLVGDCMSHQVKS